MAKIDGKYEQFWTENLLEQINSEDSITKRHHLINRYLYQREKQIEKIIASIDDDDKKGTGAVSYPSRTIWGQRWEVAQKHQWLMYRRTFWTLILNLLIRAA